MIIILSLGKLVSLLIRLFGVLKSKNKNTYDIGTVWQRFMQWRKNTRRYKRILMVTQISIFIWSVIKSTEILEMRFVIMKIWSEHNLKTDTETKLTNLLFHKAFLMDFSYCWHYLIIEILWWYLVSIEIDMITRVTWNSLNNDAQI